MTYVYGAYLPSQTGYKQGIIIPRKNRVFKTAKEFEQSSMNPYYKDLRTEIKIPKLLVACAAGGIPPSGNNGGNDPLIFKKQISKELLERMKNMIGDTNKINKNIKNFTKNFK